MPINKKRNKSKPAKGRDSILLDRKSCWEIWSAQETRNAFNFAEGYKDFISHNKTERLVVKSIKELVEKQGYISLAEAEGRQAKGRLDLKDLKVYVINRGKNIILAHFGRQTLQTGAKLILSHIDSPRLDLKVNPLYEDAGIAYLKTHYYGGIKKYHWPTIPLALYGTVVTKEGKSIELSVGDKESEPVLTISDLLPHLGAAQLEKKLSEAVQAEELNLLAGTIPDSDKKHKQRIKLAVMKLLNRQYGLTEADFISADIEIVPAGLSRDAGFDRSLVLGYGHDDRVCAYASLQAILQNKKPNQANLAVFVDKEEIGSTSNTGATSVFFYDVVGRLIALEKNIAERVELDSQIRQTLDRSEALSADVTAALDPDYKDVFDINNSARLGFGVSLEKYTGSRGKVFTSEANAEYMAKIRNIFDKAGINWQTGGLGKVDVGGGGTIAMFLAEYNMDIVDCGPPVLSMHAPYEVISKADLFASFRAYSAFYKI